MMKTLMIYFSTIYTVVKTVSSIFFCKKKYREKGFSKAKHFSVIMFLILQTFVLSQVENHQYKREIHGISEQWHKIELPDEIYKNLSKDYSDLRIVGITENQDTIEVPYLFKVVDNKPISKMVDFKIMNQSYNEKGSYFTFEVPSKEDLNSIELSFEEENFDWNVRIDGSQNQQEWFTILDDYRIVSLKNESVDFKHSELNFPTSKYRYYRLFIPTKNKPKLIKASLNKQLKTVGNSKFYSVKKFETKEEKSKTEIDIELETTVPISALQIEVENNFDYYRPITIQALIDSIETEKAWHYNYKTLHYGTLNSITNNEFEIENYLAKKLKISIENHNNEPLSISGIKVKGNVHELWCRFTKPADYYLFYGNENASKPNYDIAHFEDKIPENLSVLSLSSEEKLGVKSDNSVSPLFKNKNWLWAIMVLIIVCLGWFSFRMVGSGEKKIV